ncbi:hypothetical protein BOTU111922_26515 [Bordetella tumulicola]
MPSRLPAVSTGTSPGSNVTAVGTIAPSNLALPSTWNKLALPLTESISGLSRPFAV